MQLFPEGRLVHDFTFDKSKGKWVPWVELLPDTPIDPEAEYTTIIVQTADTLRYNFLVKTLSENNKHLLLVGPTGTGKTVYVKQHLTTGVCDYSVHGMHESALEFSK